MHKFYTKCIFSVKNILYFYYELLELFIVKRSNIFLTLIALFTFIAFSSCTELDEEVQFIENAETQAAEKTMR